MSWFKRQLHRWVPSETFSEINVTDLNVGGDLDVDGTATVDALVMDGDIDMNSNDIQECGGINSCDFLHFAGSAAPSDPGTNNAALFCNTSGAMQMKREDGVNMLLYGVAVSSASSDNAQSITGAGTATTILNGTSISLSNVSSQDRIVYAVSVSISASNTTDKIYITPTRNGPVVIRNNHYISNHADTSGKVDTVTSVVYLTGVSGSVTLYTTASTPEASMAGTIYSRRRHAVSIVFRSTRTA